MITQKKHPESWNNAVSRIPEPLQSFAIESALVRYEKIFSERTFEKMNEEDIYLRKNASETTGLTILSYVAQCIESAGLKGMPDRSFKKFLPAMEAAETADDAIRSLFKQLKPMMEKRWSILAKPKAKPEEGMVEKKPRKRHKTNARKLLGNTEEQGMMGRQNKPGGRF